MDAPELNGLVFIHADESCLGNQFADRARPGGAAGLLEVFDARRGWTRRDYFLSEPDTTNNRMALRSAIEGLRALRRPCRVVFYSDSNYLVQGMKEWIHSWAKRGWKRKGGAIENLELWVELARHAGRHTIEWRWVRGHAGHPNNEYVNQLALEAARHGKNSHGLAPSGFDAWLAARQEADSHLDFLDVPPADPFSADPKPPPPPPPPPEL
jgi:ribonuclease HI